MDPTTVFQWWHLEAAILLLCVRWSLRYSRSYRDREELRADRGRRGDQTTLYRGVQR